MATVVRIKRKADENPACTIVLASKKPKVESNDALNGSYVFSYAGTFKDPDSEEAIETLNRVKSGRLHLRDAVKSHKSDVSTKIREQHRKASKEKRLQLLLSHRAILDEITTEDTENLEPTHPRESTNDLFRIYNVAAEDLNEEHEEDPTAKESMTITCNDVPMVRCPAAPDTSRDDYVYDIYFSDAGVTLVNQESYIMERYAISEEFVPEAADESDLEFDDDSDSNAEDNWRNEYPDEDAGFEKRLDFYDDYSDDGGADCVTDRMHTVYLDDEDEYSPED
ncbi:probable RNA polymerase II nuclear localization protein SLC7A6OS [Ornithodoros turicata]|uniref:probable RNA polymerase II nuclear localization protein SLC7A6OS n=1 Tax=Ornithodoros turicata TaxID=34597 RepID=UPI003139CBCA